MRPLHIFIKMTDKDKDEYDAAFYEGRDDARDGIVGNSHEPDTHAWRGYEAGVQAFINTKQVWEDVCDDPHRHQEDEQ